MLGFSGTLAATRVAVADFSPLTITCARIVTAAVLGGIYLVLIRRVALPGRAQLFSLLVMGGGLAVGYPFFLALALQSVPAVHGAVVGGLAPAATALFAVIRLGERPRWPFWIASGIGCAAVLAFAIDAGGGHLTLADAWLLLAVLSLGIAYVEGAKVSAELGGAAALSWSMIILTPFALPVLVWTVRETVLVSVSAAGWGALAYLCGISMFLASVLWYRGLAQGGAARIGQINLLLPGAALFWAAAFLGESVTPAALYCAAVTFVAMAICLKSRTGR